MPPHIISRNQPQIGGSFGGFIGLIVGLGVIIIISCVAVFILLRRNISDSDRIARRERICKYEHTPNISSSNNAFTYSASSLPRSTGGILGGVRRMLGFGSPKSNDAQVPSYVKTRNGSGWQQADSGDAWDTTMPEFSGSSTPPPITTHSVSTQPASIQQHQPATGGFQMISGSHVPAFIPGSSSSSKDEMTWAAVPTSEGISTIPRADSPEPLPGFTAESLPSSPGSSRDGAKSYSGPGGTKFFEQL